MIIIKLPFSYSSQISTACLLAKLHDRLARCPHGITHTDMTRRYKLGPSTCVCSVNYKALSHLQAQTPYHHKYSIPDQTWQAFKLWERTTVWKVKKLQPHWHQQQTSSTISITNTTTTSSTISAFRAYHFSRRFLECPNIILATCRHKVPPTVRSDRNFSAIVSSVLNKRISTCVFQRTAMLASLLSQTVKYIQRTIGCTTYMQYCIALYYL